MDINSTDKIRINLTGSFTLLFSSPPLVSGLAMPQNKALYITCIHTCRYIHIQVYMPFMHLHTYLCVWCIVVEIIGVEGEAHFHPFVFNLSNLTIPSMSHKNGPTLGRSNFSLENGIK